MGRSPALHERLVTHWAMSDFLISQSNEFARHLNEATAEHDKIIATNTVFRIKGVPAFYLPYVYYPIRRDHRA